MANENPSSVWPTVLVSGLLILSAFLLGRWTSPTPGFRDRPVISENRPRYAPPRRIPAISQEASGIRSSSGSNFPRSPIRLASLALPPEEPATTNEVNLESNPKPIGPTLAGNVEALRPRGAAAAIDSTSQLHGFVYLHGIPPPERKIEFSDRFCGEAHASGASTRHYLVGANKGLANVMVYLRGPVERVSGDKLPPVLLDNLNCFFEPYVLGVQVGQKLQIRNSDRTIHNVNAMMKANPSFNIGMPNQGQVVEKVFNTSEINARIMCNVHPWMFAYVSILPHRYFNVTDTNGFYAMPAGLKKGKYTLVAVHPKAGEVSREIEWPSREKVEFTLELPQP